ncbi:MAG: hypothetical protein HC898_10460 [Phycisphaerales bacterium]|nr:hypothetical protein [Phycisphaerales bacterium]
MSETTHDHVPCCWCAVRTCLAGQHESMTAAQLHERIAVHHSSLSLEVFEAQLRTWFKQGRLIQLTNARMQAIYQLTQQGRGACCPSDDHSHNPMSHHQDRPAHFQPSLQALRIEID